jgi:hypothetical protein
MSGPSRTTGDADAPQQTDQESDQESEAQANTAPPNPQPPADAPPTASELLLAELEQRVSTLEVRLNQLSDRARTPQWRVKPSDMIRWALWLLVIGFLAVYWLRFKNPG